MRGIGCIALVLALAACDGRGAPSGGLGSGAPNAAGPGPASGSGGDGAAGGSGGAGAGAGVGGSVPGSCDSPPPGGYFSAPQGVCPTIESGKLTFSIGDGKTRDVELRMSDKAFSLDGPVVFAWHGLGESPFDALVAFGDDAIDSIAAEGGLVVAPYGDLDTSPYPWLLVNDERDDADLRVMDEVLACLLESHGFDGCHIHNTGFAEGAMQAALAAVRRSGWSASIVVHSPLAFDPGFTELDPGNAYPAMVFHGGVDDVTGDFVFNEEASVYAAALAQGEAGGSFHAEHFVLLCDHGAGHIVAQDAAANDSVPQFMFDHPYGIDPLPYPTQVNLPASFPDYCTVLDP